MLVNYLEGAITDAVTDALTNEKKEVAKKLFKEGSTVDFIKKITELPVEIIKRLQAELGKEQN
jgi:hypothetical protein